jgi:hypothetical protein
MKKQQNSRGLGLITGGASPSSPDARDGIRTSRGARLPGGAQPCSDEHGPGWCAYQNSHLTICPLYTPNAVFLIVPI